MSLINFSVCLTVHNKGFLLERVLDGIYNNTPGSSWELIVALDGCSDNSEEVLLNCMRKFSAKRIKSAAIYLDNVFETRANNVCAKRSSGEYVIFIQDDCIITEPNWTDRILLPFKEFTDVSAVSGNCSHEWELNPNSTDVHTLYSDSTRWCDILNHTNHANRNTIERNVFGIRSSCNRGPLAINKDDLQKLGYFDEVYRPQDMDDADFCLKVKTLLGKKVGCFWIDFESDLKWGGTRDEKGNTKSWLFEAHHKNTRIFYDRYKNNLGSSVENRTLK